jgi:hypothetical protein
MTGRRCYGIEIDPTYVDVPVKRWQEFTDGLQRSLRLASRSRKSSPAAIGRQMRKCRLQNDSRTEAQASPPEAA